MPGGLKKRVMIVEDHPLTRDGLKAIFNQTNDLMVVAESSDGETAVRLAEELRPELVVMDVGLPRCDGIEATRRIKERLPDTRIVILTAHNDETEVLAGLAAGAHAYCIKSLDPKHILTAVRVVLEGAAYLDPNVAELVLKNIVLPGRASQASSGNGIETAALSERETEVLKLVAQGLPNHEIGKALHLSVGTVKGYVRHILEKLCVNDRTQAAVVALRKGLI